MRLGTSQEGNGTPAAPTGRLRIGIDAKWLDSGPISGRVVLREFVAALADFGSTHEFVLFRKRRFLGNQPVHPFQEEPTSDRLPNLVANLTSVRRRADSLGLDAVLYQSYSPPAAKHATVCVVHDVIDLDHPEYFTRKERAYLKARRYLIPRADHVVTISESEKARLTRLGLVEDRGCTVVHWGMSRRFSKGIELTADERAAHRERLGLPSEFVLYVGRLNERKNIHRLIEGALAAEHLSAEVPLVLAGEPDGKWQRLDELGALAKDRVIWLGRVPDEDLPTLYALATLFVYVSLDEGFGLPPLEAMASGTPVVVADAGSLPEVCGPAAMYVDGRDPSSIAAAMDRLLSDEHERSRLSIAGRSRAAEFTWAKTVSNTLEAIERATRSKRVTP